MKTVENKREEEEKGKLTDWSLKPSCSSLCGKRPTADGQVSVLRLVSTPGLSPFLFEYHHLVKRLLDWSLLI